MTTTTGTTLSAYLEWLAAEAEGKRWGEVGIHLTICAGQIVDVRKTSVDTEHFPLESRNGNKATLTHRAR